MSKANRNLGAWVNGIQRSEVVGVVEHPNAFDDHDVKDCPGCVLPIYREKFNDHLRACRDVDLYIVDNPDEHDEDNIRSCPYCERPVFRTSFTRHLGVCPEADHGGDW